MTAEQLELWNKKMRDEYEYLDLINVKKFLIDDKSVYDCMMDIKKVYDKEYCKLYKDDFGLFNHISEQNFLDYILKRYPSISYYEETNYYIWNSEDKE